MDITQTHAWISAGCHNYVNIGDIKWDRPISKGETVESTRRSTNLGVNHASDSYSTKVKRICLDALFMSEISSLTESC